MLVNLSPSSSVKIIKDVKRSDTVTVVSASIVESIALLANPLRSNYSIYNAGTVIVYVREADTVTTTLYKYPIPPGHLFEQGSNLRYTGPISVITASNICQLMVSESETSL